MDAFRPGSDDEYRDDGITLIPELLNAARDRLAEEARAGKPPVEDTPESLEELTRRGWDIRDQIEARQRLRRLAKKMKGR